MLGIDGGLAGGADHVLKKICLEVKLCIVVGRKECADFQHELRSQTYCCDCICSPKNG